MTTTIFKKTHLLLILLGMIFFTATAMAQPGHRDDRSMGPPEIPSTEQIQKMVAHLAVDIEMDEQQKEKLLSVLTTHFEAVATQRETHQKEMESLKKELKSQAGEVLDENQLENFLRLTEERGPGKRPHPPHRKH